MHLNKDLHTGKLTIHHITKPEDGYLEKVQWEPSQDLIANHSKNTLENPYRGIQYSKITVLKEANPGLVDDPSRRFPIDFKQHRINDE